MLPSTSVLPETTIKFHQIKLFGFSVKWDVRQPWVKYFLGRVENQQTQLTWAYGNESMKWTHKCIPSTVQNLLTFFNKPWYYSAFRMLFDPTWSASLLISTKGNEDFQIGRALLCKIAYYVYLFHYDIVE